MKVFSFFSRKKLTDSEIFRLYKSRPQVRKLSSPLSKSSSSDDAAHLQQLQHSLNRANELLHLFHNMLNPNFISYRSHDKWGYMIESVIRRKIKHGEKCVKTQTT